MTLSKHKDLKMANKRQDIGTMIEVAVEFMAKKNNCSKATVIKAIEAKDKNALRQFSQLIEEGVKIISSN